MKLSMDDIQGVVGIVPTPATADAEDWRTEHSVNLPETEKMIQAMQKAGIDILMTNGTFGECATLTEPEMREFVSVIVDTVAGSRPVFAGITTLNTRDTIRRGRELVDIGADGLFVGRPMWLALDDAGIVRYYQDLAEAMPGVPLVIYDNPPVFKGKISPDVYRELAKIPEVIGAKHVGGPSLLSDMSSVGAQVRILPLATDWFAIAQQCPELAKACWSGGVACAPSPIMAMSRAILAQDWEAARVLSEKLVWAESAMFPGGDFGRFMDFSIQIGHMRFQAAGLINPGPPRPPYTSAPDDYAAGAIECGQRWAQLEKEYGK